MKGRRDAKEDPGRVPPIADKPLQSQEDEEICKPFCLDPADDPSATWSPDGRFIAFWSGGGLYLVSSDGGEPRRILDRGGYGPIDWRF